jgi:hypothetical protein
MRGEKGGLRRVKAHLNICCVACVIIWASRGGCAPLSEGFRRICGHGVVRWHVHILHKQPTRIYAGYLNQVQAQFVAVAGAVWSTAGSFELATAGQVCVATAVKSGCAQVHLAHLFGNFALNALTQFSPCPSDGVPHLKLAQLNGTANAWELHTCLVTHLVCVRTKAALQHAGLHVFTARD